VADKEKIYIVGAYYGDSPTDCDCEVPFDMESAWVSKDLAYKRAKEIGGEVREIEIKDK
jgi:hypothetical protein